MTPTAKPLTRADPLRRFRALYTPSAGCWLWSGGRTGPRRNYGSFWLNGRHERAHRASYALHVGPIPAGLDVCHRCDVGLCVNPAHLFLGTRQQNMLDCVAKGRHNTDTMPWRHSRGSANGAAKLNDEDVREIRRMGAAGIQRATIGKLFGVHRTAVGAILRGETWRHLLPAKETA